MITDILIKHFRNVALLTVRSNQILYQLESIMRIDYIYVSMFDNIQGNTWWFKRVKIIGCAVYAQLKEDHILSTIMLGVEGEDIVQRLRLCSLEGGFAPLELPP